MAIPSINESPAYEVISSGVAYAKTLTATNTPTSWALSGQPSGVTINNSGAISGTPSVTTATAYTFSATATNGDGTSTAVTWLAVVVPYAVGGPVNAFARALDLDLNFGTLQIPGVGSPLPKSRASSPAQLSSTEEEFGDETEYLTRWSTGDRFTLSLGVPSAGVLQDLPISRIYATLRESEDAPGITIDEGDIDDTGSDATARFETTLHLDRDLLDPIVGGFETQLRTVAPMLLGISVEVPDDARDYDSAVQTETITTLTQSSNVVDSFDINLPAASQITTGTKYDIEIKLICPTDTGLNVTLNRQATITWNGSAYVLGTVTGDDTGTGTSTVSVNWDTELENSTLSCDATGFVVGTTVTAAAQTATVASVDVTLDGAISGFTVDGTTVAHATSFTVDFLDGGASIIGSSVTISNGDTEADVLAAIELATGEEVTSVVFDTGTGIFITFGAGSIVEDESTTSDVTVNMTTIPSYSNTYVTVQITGVEMPEKSETITSAAVPILIERKMTR